MTSPAAKTRATIIPALRYRDAPAAIEWLCDAFGFEKHLVVPGEDGSIVHAQLGFGDGMVMLGSSRDDVFGQLIKTPSEAGGCTQAPYVVVADIDAHYQKAKAAGATIVAELERWDHGGSGYTCRDLEGNVWTFGSYDPWPELQV